MADSNCFVFVSHVVHNKIHTLDGHPELAKWYSLCYQQPGPKRVLDENDAFWVNYEAQ